MSEKDCKELGANARAIENGVDFERFQPEAEKPGRRLLFIGSFRHFPNIAAFRFLTEEIFPRLSDVDLTVVAGPDPWLHWRNFTGTLRPPEHPRVRMLEFVSDVRPLYVETNLVLVPTLESAGTNVKVLEALAMQRAVVSTASGCAGLGLEHGSTAWIADSPKDLADGIMRLLDDVPLRNRIAQAGFAHTRSHFDWRSIGCKQRELLRELAAAALTLRPARAEDLADIERIQAASPEAAQWRPGSYLEFECIVAVHRQVIGFVVLRRTAPDEREILNLAVDPAHRRRGVARQLIEDRLRRAQGSWFLEVRESNLPAIHLYESLGFHATGRREAYYNDPAEAGIVMRIHS